MAVAIVDYDPTWPDQFEQLATALRRHLGDAVLAIDHIGSTAVPGLAAKDIIDIQVSVADLADADRLAPAFQQAGYTASRYRLDHQPAGDTSDPAQWGKRLWQSPWPTSSRPVTWVPAGAGEGLNHAHNVPFNPFCGATPYAPGKACVAGSSMRRKNESNRDDAPCQSHLPDIWPGHGRLGGCSSSSSGSPPRSWPPWWPRRT